MKTGYILGLLFFMGFTSQAQTPRQQKAFDQMLDKLLAHSVKEVRAQELIGQSGVIFLDAREKQEFEVSHIPQARWIGYDTFQKKYVQNLPKTQRIVVYCSVGYRSEKISEKLLKMGFQKVENLYGGIFGWKHARGKLVNSQAQRTEKVHTFNQEWSKWLFKGVKVY